MYNKKKPLNPVVQIGAMKSRFPDFRSKHKDGNIVFTGDLVIKPELPIYNVSVEYRGNSRPLVRVNSPTLVDDPPHFYHSTKSLCLYRPADFKWNGEKLIAKEIMQWTIAWIYFYEYWLQTGEWIGPEAAHNTDKKDD